jgi:uncharacterized protein with GYD domain
LHDPEAPRRRTTATAITTYTNAWLRDGLAICDAPDDEAATLLAPSVGLRGNARSETLRASSFDEMKRILGKLV